MVLVRFLDLKFLYERAAKLEELQIHRTSGDCYGGVWYPKWTHFRDGRAVVSNH